MSLYWLLVFFAGVNSAVGNFFLKKSQEEHDFINSIFSYEFFLGCFFYFINVLLFAYALKEIDASKAYPVLAGISFGILALIGSLYLNETLVLKQLAGIVLVIFAIYLIAS
jgi:multidrug transporter EmrE-like cation transporter